MSSSATTLLILAATIAVFVWNRLPVAVVAVLNAVRRLQAMPMTVCTECGMDVVDTEENSGDGSLHEPREADLGELVALVERIVGDDPGKLEKVLELLLNKL